MKIGIDARCLEEERISGVGEYTLEIIQNLLERDSKNQYIIFSNAYKEPNNNLSFLRKYPNAELKRFRFPNKLLNFSLWYFNWPKLDKLVGGVDIIFTPNINFLAVDKKCKLIATFHDLSFERYPDFFSLKTRLWHNWFVNPRRIAGRADQAIAVSNSTKEDLAEVYKIDPKKVNVVYHGVSENYEVINRNDPKLLEVQKKYSLPYKFVLFLGNLDPRKNISALIEAYLSFRENNPKMERYKLVLCGNISQPLHDIIEKSKESEFGQDITIAGYIDREDKPYVYNLASLFVYPSHFEGFGLPLLEAMACGTPVVASNNSSIPEVVRDAATIFDPNRPEELVEAMENILQDEKLYNVLRERGLRQVQKFSWKKCAEETLKVLTN